MLTVDLVAAPGVGGVLPNLDEHLVTPHWSMIAFATLFFLTGVTAVSALCMALRTRPSGRAELLLTTTLIWNALILVPIYVLGYANRLYAYSLGPAAFAVALAVFAVAARGVGPAPLLRDARTALAGLARLPRDAAAIAWRAGSLIWVGVVLALMLLAWTTITAYLAPPCIHYDSTWYHDTIVGFTLQNHGFQFVEIALPRVNSYPRVCEMTQVWFVLFTDRRMIEMANCAIAPAIVASVYLLCRRFTGDVLVALGFASSFLFVPGAMIQLQSTAVDLHTTLLLLAALNYTVRARFRVRDAWLTGVALVLALGAKFITLVAVGTIALCAAVRLIANHRRRIGPVVATLTGVGLLMAMMLGPTLVRNYVHYGNPFYPHIVSDRWPGNLERGQIPGHVGVDLNLPWSQVFDQLTAEPAARIADGLPIMSYGMGVPFLLLPLVVLALFVAGREFFRAAFEWQPGVPAEPRRWRDLAALGTIALVSFTTLYTSPARWGSRYNLLSVVIAMALVTWFCAHHHLRRVAEGVGTLMIFTGLLAAWWREPFFLTTPRQLWHLLSIPFPLREVALERGPTGRVFGPVRETLLGDGEILAFNEHYGLFPSLLWNSRFSNRLIVIPASPSFVVEAEAAGARWILCENGDSSCDPVTAPGSAWEPVGHASVESLGQVYHRRTPAPKPE